MRRFIVTAHAAPTEPFFNLDDLPGAGRMDVLCRAVNAAFLTSHGIRRDVVLDLVLRDTYTITFAGEELGGVNPDTRSIAGVIQNAVTQAPMQQGERVHVSNGVTITQKGFADTVNETALPVVWLHEDGDRFTPETCEDACFVLSDHKDFTQAEASLLEEVGAAKTRLGSTGLHTDHAVTVTQHLLDTAHSN